MINRLNQPFVKPLTEPTLRAVDTILIHLQATASSDTQETLQKLLLAMVNMVIADAQVNLLKEQREEKK